MEFLKVFGIIFVTFGIGFLLINIRQIIIGEEFRGTCSSNNPMLKNEIGECTVCGAGPNDVCKNEDDKTKLEPLPEIKPLFDKN